MEVVIEDRGLVIVDRPGIHWGVQARPDALENREIDG
jgi:hypothetical protein